MFYIKLSRIVRSAVPFVVGLAVFLNTAHAEEVRTAKSKPTVYIHIIKENDPQDKAVENAYAKKFTIVEVRDNKQFTKAVLKECILPRPELDGRVTVDMIVTSDGRVIEPFVLESVDSRRNSAALDAVRQWRFTPARLNGSPVSETVFTVLGGSDLMNVRQWAISTPQPRYPTYARAKRITGYGYFRIEVEIKTGLVKNVHVEQSTGDPALDSAALEALQQWQFKPGVLPSIRKRNPQTKLPHADEYARIRVPIVFSLRGITSLALFLSPRLCMTYSFLRKFSGSGFATESRLTSCSVFTPDCLYGGRNSIGGNWTTNYPSASLGGRPPS